MRILAVGAHPDDIEIGCGGTLIQYKQKGHEVFFLVLSHGEASGDPRIREKECKLAAKIIGAEIFFGDLKDTKITDGIETIMAIENVINRLNADIIFSHSSKDGHQDHRNVGLATLSAARRSKKVFLYESPAALREFCPQVFVNIGSTFKIKMKALEAFDSQATKPYFQGVNMSDESRKFTYVLNAVEGLAVYRGFQAGVQVAEAFEVGRFILEI
ncbi:MAG: PIG-L deacetylase family protein [Candidatus Helarchaeota archaeon]